MSQPQTMNYVFDANQHEPAAGQSAIPADTYNLEIASTAIEDLKDDKGQTFKVGSKVTDGPYAGAILYKRYNLWNKMSAENSRISHNELSALSHVTGIFKIDMNNAGAALKGARYRAKVTNDGQYNEIKEVFDVNGNKPAQAGTGYSAPQTAPVASAAPGQGAWGAQPAAAAPVATAPAAPAAPAAPVAPVAFPPAGWQAHPTAQGYFYKDQEVLTEAQLREKMAASTAPAAPVAPAAPTAPAAAPAQPAAWGQQAAPAAAAPSAPWGAPAA